MKLSEMIGYLKKCQKDNGDIEVMLPSGLSADSSTSDTVTPCGVVTILNEDEKPAYALICDDMTMDAFA